MKKGKARDSDRDFLARLDQLSDEVPIDDAEAEAVLADAGIDPGAALARVLGRVAGAEADQKHERYALAEAERRSASAKLATPSSKRTRAQLLDRLEQLKAGGDQPQAYFRSLQSVPDEDLDSLVLQLEELVARGQKP